MTITAPPFATAVRLHITLGGLPENVPVGETVHGVDLVLVRRADQVSVTTWKRTLVVAVRSGSRFRVRGNAGVVQNAGFVADGPGIVARLDRDHISG